MLWQFANEMNPGDIVFAKKGRSEIIGKGIALEEISHAAEADVNLVVSAAGLGAARVLCERFGMPYAVGVPIGNELPGLLADQMILKARELKALWADDPEGMSFERMEISVQSGVFLNGGSGETGTSCESPYKDPYKKGFAAVIGEGVASLSLAGEIEMEYGIPAKVLCATECPAEILRECDRITPDEDDIIPELEGAAFVIADPLYEPIIPKTAKFIPLPSEAFSGRIYRDEIPDLIKEFKIDIPIGRSKT